MKECDAALVESLLSNSRVIGGSDEYDRKIETGHGELVGEVNTTAVGESNVDDKAPCVRSDLAMQDLADRELSISRIAWLLGYQEVGALTHAFRRWKGQTPRQARAK